MSRLASWIETANTPETEFPLNNLPYGVFSTDEAAPHCGVAIGDLIFDVTAAERAGVISVASLSSAAVFAAPSWNAFMGLGAEVWSAFRAELMRLLSDPAQETAVSPHLIAQSEAQMHLPFEVSEYTDFYAGKHHAYNVGCMFRDPENALPENWLSIPIGYNGRASSVVVSGTPFHRPWGQIKAPGAALPHLAPSARFDFELEIGAIVGQPSQDSVSLEQADAMIFGYVLLNDWSARDIQAWEYQPLGPFQAKATATTISPWIVTKAALEPFRTKPPMRERPLLDYLVDPWPMHYDIDLEVALTPESGPEEIIARTNANMLYYSAAQQLCHHTLSGCRMRIGDLLGSGTISGETPESYGSMLELSWGGERPIKLAKTTRSFLEDGDTVTLRGYAQTEDFRIGFGDCRGTVLPPKPLAF